MKSYNWNHVCCNISFCYTYVLQDSIDTVLCSIAICVITMGTVSSQHQLLEFVLSLKVMTKTLNMAVLFLLMWNALVHQS